MQVPNIGFGPMPNAYKTFDPEEEEKNKKKKIFLFGVGFFVLLVVIGFLSFGKKVDPIKEAMIDLSLKEAETLRLDETYREFLTDPVMLRNSADIKATLTSNGHFYTTELKSRFKTKNIPSKRRKASVDSVADEKLATAIRLNRIDKEYAIVIAERLAEELRIAQELQGKVKNQEFKQQLSGIANNIAEVRNRLTNYTTQSGGQ